ncbi:phosphoethanolamine transferase [Aquariibacter albus]|uniref:Phosphoethanolamine--lipid A transferase n=1 Tax=Aquariibacter albus TaxID=2759899 RepID=A0A839HNK3_9BURK|nr:phosphoethanolamine--lipid A transferase [Aquariibacter albus]MBB1160869.1 phosphoethanolamine--lipid A transferase [Aquariibacter albus]
MRLAPLRKRSPQSAGESRPGLSATWLAGGVAAWLVAVDNLSFWRTFIGAQSPTPSTVAATIALALVLWTFTTAVLRWAGPPRVARVVFAVLLLASAPAAHFVDVWGVLLDRGMVQNVLQTDLREALDLLTGTLALDVLLRGVLPAVAVLLLPVRPESFRASWRSSVVLSVLAGLTLGAALTAFYAIYAPTFRNHRELRLQLVPSNYLGGLYGALRPKRLGPLTPVALDAKRADAAGQRPLLVVLVVGETARADNFSLGGYARPTNDALDGQPIVYFPDVTSCGTDTATSLPCMFSGLGVERFSVEASQQRENLLDVLKRTGVQVTWVDNNSGCKRVCDRVPTVRLHELHCKPDADCLDGLLVDALERQLAITSGDALVVLHQQGSHGPAYFKRYPQPARFQPTCETNRLQDCTPEAIVNTYDNTIDYTSRILARAIDTLQQEVADRDVLLLYVSDHGESLGERGVFLHGMPRWVAPHEQSHVPMLLWMNETAKQRLAPNTGCLKAAAQQKLSHDNLFHTLLGAFGVSTGEYAADLDVLAGARGRTDCPVLSAPKVHLPT